MEVKMSLLETDQAVENMLSEAILQKHPNRGYPLEVDYA
jgi:hypothetical protein